MHDELFRIFRVQQENHREVEAVRLHRKFRMNFRFGGASAWRKQYACGHVADVHCQRETSRRVESKQQ